jgi:hypothetical protein
MPAPVLLNVLDKLLKLIPLLGCESHIAMEKRALYKGIALVWFTF